MRSAINSTSASNAFARSLTRSILASLVLFASPALAIVNGADATDPRYQAVVHLAYGCTGTFVHPYFVLTAAHCLIQSDDGPAYSSVTDGEISGTGSVYGINYAYRARRSDLGGSELQDVALLQTVAPFTGPTIPILPNQDLPHGAEDYYCPRWEFTWPTLLGYSNNVNSEARRRVGRAFAECDLEQHDDGGMGDLVYVDTVGFKVDGDGRSVQGVRICRGDSGGPALWDTGFGGMAVGGVISSSDTGTTECPSGRGESFISFIPRVFLDRVARTSSICSGTLNWDDCTKAYTQVDPYADRQLHYLGTENDECGEDVLTVPSTSGNVELRHGDTRAVEVGTNRFPWYCASSQEWTTAPNGTNFVVAKRALTDRKIIWDAYQRGLFVPNVIGSAQGDATASVNTAGLSLGAVSSIVSTDPIGSIVSQDPAGGAFVNPGSAVSIGVSVGAVMVPSVNGDTKSSAISALNRVGLNARVSLQKQCIEPDAVVAQFPPAGGLVAPGASVAIVVDSGTLKTCGVIR